MSDLSAIPRDSFDTATSSAESKKVSISAPPKTTKRVRGGGDEVSAMILAAACMAGAIALIIWGSSSLGSAGDAQENAISWQPAKCDVHAALLRSWVHVEYNYMTDNYETSYKYTVAYDVTVYPAGTGEGESREGGIHMPLACKNFDEGLGQCVVEEMDDPDVDCDVPVDEANCDTDQQPTDFWGQAKKFGRSKLIDCGCEICAVSQQACADATGPFQQAYGAAEEEQHGHQLSCCYPDMPGTERGPVGESVENEGSCVFPFRYNDKTYNSCTFENSDNYYCSHSADYDEDGDWGDCDLSSYKSPVTVYANADGKVLTDCSYDGNSPSMPAVEFFATEESHGGFWAYFAIISGSIVAFICTVVCICACKDFVK